ncbi:MAG TPA: hypothetical protein VF061_04355, partial [Gemmatimonadales bacterium]
MNTYGAPNQPGIPPSKPSHGDGGQGGHRWMMIACCVPMLLVAVVLVATGVAGAGALFAAIACTLMMIM